MNCKNSKNLLFILFYFIFLTVDGVICKHNSAQIALSNIKNFQCLNIKNFVGKKKKKKKMFGKGI